MRHRHQIFFFFNQLLEPHLYTGGDIRGNEILNYFNNDSKFKTYIICPKISIPCFSKKNIYSTGHLLPESLLSRSNLFIIVIMYIFRSFETLKYIQNFKNNYIYSTGDFFCNIFPSFITKLFYPKTRWITVIHHININPFKRKSNTFLSNLFSYIFQQFSFILIKHFSNIIFTVNQDVNDYLISSGFQQPVITVGNGLNITDILSKIKKNGKTKQKNQICYFGRITPTKGVLDLPKILSKILIKYPNYKLHLVGHANPEFLNIMKKKFIHYHCLDKVIYHGYVEDYYNVYRIILESNVCVFTSYEEGWGISLFEAIMCQRPIVAYNLPIYKNLFGSNLITVKLGDTDKFAKSIIKIIDNPRSKKIINSIHKCYLTAKKYDWKHVYNQEKKYIQNL